MKWLFSLCLLVGALVPAQLLAQLDVVMVYGTVKDMSTAKKLDGVTVTVFKNGEKLVEVVTNASGKYEVNLDYGADYKLMCAKAGFVGKNITIDTRSVPEEDRQGGHGMNIDFTMMAEIQGVDYSILLEPFGKSEYVKASGTFEWDHEYTSRMRDAQARLLKEYENRKKREANAEEEYAKAMKQGTDAMSASDFNKAVSSFTDALDIKPNDPVATAKLSDARMRLEGMAAEQQLNDQYADLIKDADGAYSSKDFETARTKYTAALELKENEAHPKQRLKDIDVQIAELAKQAEEEKKARELQEKYDAAITAADNAFKSDELNQAETKYREAGELKSQEQYPKDQLAAVSARRADLAKKLEEEQQAKAIQEQYEAAIKAADAAFNSASWDVATSKYTEASSIKNDEQYPKDQLAAIELKKNEAEQKAEEERIARELQEKYQAAITAGDAAFKADDLDQAAARYNEALGFKSEEKYPQNQLVAIETRRQELANKQDEERRARELDEQYQAAIAAADAAFNGADWDQATSKYTEASGLKQNEAYPKDQLAAIERKKAELAEQEAAEREAQEKEEQYQNAIVAADAAFDSQDWQNASDLYGQASSIKPSESYPKERIELIKARIAEAEEQREQEEIDARYNAAIAEADQNFDSGELANARAKYQAALEIKPGESHPKTRIGEIDEAIAEQERLAKEELKKQEFEARYADLIARADQAFDAEEFSAALNDYKDALQMKPSEEHPKTRIATIESELDAAARETAEKERLLREQQERDQRYNDIVAIADQAFDSGDLQKARSEYENALEVKPGESHPGQRILAIDELIAQQANDADEQARQEELARLAAEREAQELARQAELDSLAAAEARAKAEQDELDRLAAEREAEELARQQEAERLAQESAAERALREEEELRRMEAEADAKARYNAHIMAADRAFSGNEFDLAREKYNDALAVDPDAQHPKDRLAAIDAALDEQRRLSEQSDEEAARLAAEAEREAEQLRLEQERLAMEEEERRKMEDEAARNERYTEAITEADLALAEQRYEDARGKYAMASDIKPQEEYPLGKIDQIDKILADQEKARLEAELAAQNAKKEREVEKPRNNTTIDIRKEQEAEQFMRAAKEREEAEKYERIKKFKADLSAEELEAVNRAEDRRMEGVAERDRHLEHTVGLYTGDEGRRRKNAEEMEALREQLARAEAERIARADQQRQQNLDENQAIQDEKAARDQEWDRLQQEQSADMARSIQDIRSTEEDRSRLSMEKNIELKEQADALAASHMQMKARGAERVADRSRQLEEEKRAYELREAQLVNKSEQSRSMTKEQLDQVQRDLPQNYADQNRSKLASEYQPGITEESYTEGNKVIIRRIVVMGNRADEYSKVIAKWGTFYFKNGQSITEAMWSEGTEL